MIKFNQPDFANIRVEVNGSYVGTCHFWPPNIKIPADVSQEDNMEYCGWFVGQIRNRLRVLVSAKKLTAKTIVIVPRHKPKAGSAVDPIAMAGATKGEVQLLDGEEVVATINSGLTYTADEIVAFINKEMQ